jgi:hypothetical protein
VYKTTIQLRDIIREVIYANTDYVLIPYINKEMATDIHDQVSVIKEQIYISLRFEYGWF